MTIRRHPCGCTSHQTLDPRHIIHYDSTTPDDPLDLVKVDEAFKLLERARGVHRQGCVAMSPELVETARPLYKKAAMAFAEANDVMGAVTADSYDLDLDRDIERIKTWEPLELARFFGI